MSGLKNNRGPWWIIVIFFIIVFFPVGFYLLYKKLTADKTNFLGNSKVNNVYGCVLVIICIIEIFMTLSTQEEISVKIRMISIFIIFFGVIGYSLLLKAKKLKNKPAIYKKYLSAVGMKYMSDIDTIAVDVSVNYRKAEKDLQEMINFGLFEDGYINQSSRKLIIPSRKIDQYNETNVETIETRQVVSTPKIKVITCNSCGAKKTVTIGKVTKCEYCGSPLS